MSLCFVIYTGMYMLPTSRNIFEAKKHILCPTQAVNYSSMLYSRMVRFFGTEMIKGSSVRTMLNMLKTIINIFCLVFGDAYAGFLGII